MSPVVRHIWAALSHRVCPTSTVWTSCQRCCSKPSGWQTLTISTTSPCCKEMPPICRGSTHSSIWLSAAHAAPGRRSSSCGTRNDAGHQGRRRIAVIDMIADPTPRIAEETNRLERLRDPSNGRTLTAAEITHLIEDAGAVIEGESVQDQPLDLEDWMARTETPAANRDEIRQRLDEEMQGGFPAGLRPARDADGQVTFVHPWIAAVARVRHGPDK
jgi:hypothetical protein